MRLDRNPLGSSASSASLVALGHAFLAVALFKTGGHEGIIGLLLVLMAVGLWITATRNELAGVRPEVDRGASVLWGVALGSTTIALAVFLESPGAYVQTSLAPFLALDGLATGVVASFYLDVVRGVSLPAWVVVGRRVALFALAFLIGAWMLHASPDPQVDLFPLHQQAAEVMLAGKSIYTPGSIHTVETFHHTDVLDAYVYPPLPACISTVAYALTHEFRWADLVSQIVGALFLWLVARRVTPAGASPRRAAWGDLLAATFLFHPRGPYVLEEGWTEPLAIPFLGAFVWLVLRGRPRLACVPLGLFFAIKQHLVLYAPFLMLVPGVGFAGIVIAGLVAVATLVPFAFPSPYNLFRGAFLSVFRNPFRYDALSLPATLHRIGITIPSWVGFLAALGPMALLPRAPRKLSTLLLLTSLTYCFFYVLGRQAFCNYYYLLDVTVLFAAACFEAD